MILLGFVLFPVLTPPQVAISPPSLSVREGDSAQFRCSASGFPAPFLQWHGGPGGRLPSEAVLSNGNGLLTFFNAKKIHEGEYFCTASNVGGISSKGTFLSVLGTRQYKKLDLLPSPITPRHKNVNLKFNLIADAHRNSLKRL